MIKVNCSKEKSKKNSEKKKEKEVLFLKFSEILQKIENTSSRLEKQNILSKYISEIIKIDETAVISILFMCSASVFSSFENLEMNIGEKTIQQICAECCGFEVKTLKKEFIKVGDYANIVYENKNKKNIKKFFDGSNKQENLGVVEVFEMLRQLCKVQGAKSGEFKKMLVIDKLRRASPLECKFIIRLLDAKLKIGLALQIILISFAMAVDIDPDIIKDAYNRRPDFIYLIKTTFKNKNCLSKDIYHLCTGIPLKPMLASPATSVQMVFDKLNEFVAEYKYDGERIQIHSFFDNNEQKVEEENKVFTEHIKNDDIRPDNIQKDWFGVGVNTQQKDDIKSAKQNKNILYNKLFSRNSENISEKYDDIAKIKFHEKSYILDGEVVAYKGNEIQPFQILATRKRKLEANKESVQKVGVCIFVFDILYFDGKELLDLPLKERINILITNFEEIPGVLQFTKSINSNHQIEEINDFFNKACRENCEGLVLKDLSAKYKPSHRSNKWIKLKKDYIENIGDSLDLVVVGAFFGKGKRTGKYGGFLLACYNEEEDQFEPVCKLGTGFSDENLETFSKNLKIISNDEVEKYKISRQSKILPDVYVDPSYVWEIKAASFSLSPLYKAGEKEVGKEKGISLRFPRFLKEREDKSKEMATTTKQIVDMFYLQENNVFSDKKTEHSSEDMWN